MPKSPTGPRGSATKAPYDSPNSRGQEDDVPEFALGCDFDGKGGPEPEYEDEDDPIHYIPKPPPEWDIISIESDQEKDTRHDPLSLTKRLAEDVKKAEVDWEEASKRLFKTKMKLDMHMMMERVKARIAEIEAAVENGKCSICLKGDADPDDCPYCEDCDVHVQNVSKHSPHREFFDICPIAWDEWWVPRELYNRLMAHLMLTSEGKLKQELEF